MTPKEKKNNYLGLKPQTILILRSLADGEWHYLEYDSTLTNRMRPLVNAKLIWYHCTGKIAQAIATDMGLEYIKGLGGSK